MIVVIDDTPSLFGNEFFRMLSLPNSFPKIFRELRDWAETNLGRQPDINVHIGHLENTNRVGYLDIRLLAQ
jgi:hypothetical protein